jgi:hypothetical protein
LEEETMKAKIFIVLFAVLLAAGSLSLAGDQKPFKGWVEQIGASDPTIDPLDYPYLAEIIAVRGMPPLSQLTLYKGVNNVGGASLHENAQMIYWGSIPFTLDIYEDETITVANGDQIFLTVIGTIYLDPNTFEATGYLATDTVTGGTGRFEGAAGSIKVVPGIDAHGMPTAIFDGQIKTVGNAKKK